MHVFVYIYSFFAFSLSLPFCVSLTLCVCSHFSIEQLNFGALLHIWIFLAEILTH